MMKLIRLTKHVQEQAVERGTTDVEIEEALGSGKIPAVVLEGLKSADAPLTVREKPSKRYGS